jgi:hypothetical protein
MFFENCDDYRTGIKAEWITPDYGALGAIITRNNVWSNF